MLKLLAILSLIYYCHAYSKGAPVQVCDDMTPQHHVDPQSIKFPYKITISKDQVSPGETVDIGVTNGDFKGLLIQVRDGDKSVGEFVVADNDASFKTIPCHGTTAGALTHKNADTKNNVLLKWKAPAATGKYVVYATVAKDGAVFWVRQPTQIISVV